MVVSVHAGCVRVVIGGTERLPGAARGRRAAEPRHGQLGRGIPDLPHRASRCVLSSGAARLSAVTISYGMHFCF